MEHLSAGKRAAPIGKPWKKHQRVILKETGYPEGYVAQLLPNKSELKVRYIPYGGEEEVTETIHLDYLLPLQTTGTTLKPTLPPSTFEEVQAKMWGIDLLSHLDDTGIRELLEKEFNMDAETTAYVRNDTLEEAIDDWASTQTLPDNRRGCGWWLEAGMPVAWTFKEILDQNDLLKNIPGIQIGEHGAGPRPDKDDEDALNWLAPSRSILASATKDDMLQFCRGQLRMDKHLIDHTLADWEKWKVVSEGTREALELGPVYPKRTQAQQLKLDRENADLGGGGGNRGRYRLRKQTKRRRKTRKRKSRRRKSSRRRKTRRR